MTSYAGVREDLNRSGEGARGEKETLVARHGTVLFFHRDFANIETNKYLTEFRAVWVNDGLDRCTGRCRTYGN